LSLTSSRSLLVGSCAYRYLDSFPTRRSSDLNRYRTDDTTPSMVESIGLAPTRHTDAHGTGVPRWTCSFSAHRPEYPPGRATSARSEEHTSELQSRENLVCRLLLEKKKHKTNK